MDVPRPRRAARAPIWLLVVEGLLLLTVAGFWTVDTGDLGVRNAATIIGAGLGLATALLWLCLFSGARPALRASVGGLAVVLVGGLAACFRLEGFSGSMIPRFAWRFGAGSALEDEPTSTAGGIDLTPTSHDFPGFLGRARDGRVPNVRLDPDWASRPPRVLWRRDVGAAWSGFAIVNRTAFTMEQHGDDEVVSAFDLDSGARLWTYAHIARFENFLGGVGPHGTPLVDEGRVYALGAVGHLVCLDGTSGEPLWEHDLLELFGVTPEMEETNVLYGRSASPLVVDQLVVVPAGGDPSTRMAGLVAFDKVSGELVWESPPRQVSHSSPTRATLAGRDQIVVVNQDSVTGHDVTTGAILWETRWPGKTSGNASCSQPTIVDGERVLLSKGYGVGSKLLRIVRDGEGYGVEELWRNRRALRTKLTNPVLFEGHAYGLVDERLECTDVETGERVWREGSYGHGQLLLVGELLLVVSEEGLASLVRPSPEEPNDVLATLPALEGKCWNTLAVAGERLLLRSDVEAVCLEVGGVE